MNHRQLQTPRVLVKLVQHQQSQNLSSYILYTLKSCHEINLTIFYRFYFQTLLRCGIAELHVFLMLHWFNVQKAEQDTTVI